MQPKTSKRAFFYHDPMARMKRVNHFVMIRTLTTHADVSHGVWGLWTSLVS